MNNVVPVEILQNSLYTFGPLALIPLLMIEAPLMAISGGFLVGMGEINAVTMFVAYITSDVLVTHMYFFAGRSSKHLFKFIKNKFDTASKKSSKRIKIISFLKEKLTNNFVLGYTITKFLPIPYSTTSATIIAGTFDISYKKFRNLITILIPLQGIVYIGIGYLLAEGLLNKITPIRIFGLSAVTILILAMIYYTLIIKKSIENQN